MKTNGHSPRIVVTGIGAITPLAHTWPETWEGLVAGKSACRRITHFDPADFPTQIAASVRDFDAEKYMDAKEARRMTRLTHYAWAATQEAIAESGLDLANEDRDRVGIDIGSAFGSLDLVEDNSFVMLQEGHRKLKAAIAPAVLISTTPCYIAIQLGITGPVNSQVTACATGITSIGESMRRMQRGETDVMIAGGVDAYQSRMLMWCFSRLGAMSTRNDEPETACRPFCNTRDGMIMGEGSTVLVLETLEHAQARGANILAEVGGYSLTSDAFHLAAPDPSGRGASRAMMTAMREAGASGEDIDYICAHGTATRLNDTSETAAIKIALGEAAYDTRISSIKSMVGHMMGAAGAIGAAALVGAIQNNLVPPTINYHEPDPDCDLNYVPNAAQSHQVDAAMVNAFGFGGQNASMVMLKYVE